MTTPPGTIVVALGGNALSPPAEQVSIHDQFRHTRESLASVVALAKQGWNIAIVHGNGPQVGDALERNERSRDRVAPLPLGVLVAATAGWIGYMIQQSLQNAFDRGGVSRDVLTMITQTQVNRSDPALARPSKPIGHVLSQGEVDELTHRGVAVGQDRSGRWWRLAPSPLPIDIVEAAAVRQLVDEGKVVIAAGGGGPPVCCDERTRCEGVDAVVDKDRVAAILATCIGAEVLLILTNVNGVYRDWGSPRAARLERLGIDEAAALLDDDGLGVGSMRPKVDAALSFLRGGGRRAIIAHLTDGLAAIRGDAGTVINGPTA